MSLKRMIILGILIAALLFILPYSVVFVLALVTAIILEPLVKLLIKRVKMKRAVAVIISFVLFLAFFFTATYLIGAQIVVQSIELAERLPLYSSYIFDTVKSLFTQMQDYYVSLPPESVQTTNDVLDAIRVWATAKASALAGSILGLVTGIPGFLIETIIYMVALFLIMTDLPGLQKRFMSMFTPSAQEKITLVFTQLGRAATGFLAAQVFLSLLTYVLALAGLLILDVKYAMIIALIIMIVDILPILGTGSFLVPWAIYSIVTGNMFLGVGLIILFTAITVIRRIVEPKVLGTSLGISSLAALVSIWLGFQVLGFAGLIIGPALVIIFEAMRKAGFLRFKIDF